MTRVMRAVLLCLAMLGNSLPGQVGAPRSPPQDPPRGEAALPPFELGPGNWPVPPEGFDARSDRSARSDFEAPAAEHWPVPAPAPGGAGPALSLDSPLRDVFKAVRQPADLAALGGVTVWLRLTLYDELGEELGTREITHEADLQHPDRDRLMFADGRVYGRLGDTVFARRNRRPWPTLQEEARDELELFGTLLRVPWIFRDVSRFQVFPADDSSWVGAELVRVRIERRPRAAPPPRGGSAPVDRFDLICDPDTYAPRQLHVRLAASGASRRILLDDYREVGSVRMPWRRTILVEGDRAAMVMQITRIEVGQNLREQHFRPHAP